ncbi:CaiB/BaiF CoA-transferase family protein [Gordonia sp. (in: high G+C Gram-positive bacteria)]|uniref:CaiB/BaiF CoA transferase family protein n=1 Tax=Gordonia sp. (in: high G+C Gram-positive bacteria) TaxID=84139 RepID=UPI00168F0B7A|nr:CaiB/BaiF CoA-transferase family protein [Gordonia sp. (in: high G+C Gram-positive bacteria)]NLG47608.1 CoA transferase [Gordonia sp. (in: high G+C Gram-positive bacteria)]
MAQHSNPLLPLDGMVVVTLEQAVAVPLASRHLADMGARVIKIERTDGGDFARAYDTAVHGTGAHFVWLNRGKESLAVDLKTDDGRDIVRTLIGKADVFLQNLAPGAAERLGFGSDVLRADHPELVTVDLSGYGADGPFQDRKAYDMLIQAESGLISITGTPDDAVKTGIPTADIASGMYCAQAVLAALLRRYRTGEGARIEVSMLEATVEWMGHSLYTQMYTGAQPPRMGVSHVSIAPYDSYPTLDGQILIGVQSDGGWNALTEVLGIADLATDPRFDTNIHRVENRAACDAVVAEQTRGWTTAELDAALAGAGIPAAQIKELSDVAAHPQLAARDRWRTVGTEFAQVKALLPPVTFADVAAVMGDVPALGRHTAALLAEMGYDQNAIDRLATAGVVGLRAQD